jgi:acyl-CoA thioesterase-1
MVKVLGFITILSVLTACLAAEGCRQSSGYAEASRAAATPVVATPAANQQPPSTAVDQRDRRQVIVCFGDSLTAGYGTDTGESYPDVLQRNLDAQGYHYRVSNQGISGDTTKDGLERIQRVLAEHPQIVVVEFGGNDGLRGLPLEQTQANLDAMLAQLKASGAQVALAGITLPPDYGHDYIARFNAMYTSLAKKYRVPLLPFLLQDVYGVAGDIQDDHTHATAQGNKQVAVNVERLIQPMLKR